MNAINSSHDFRLGKFDHQEDTLVTGISKTLEKTIQTAHDKEITRNRDRICEIIAFLDKCSSEIEGAEESAFWWEEKWKIIAVWCPQNQPPY